MPLPEFLLRLGVEVPILQAPMAGVATPALAAAVSNAGGLGALGIGASAPETARGMIAAVRAKTDRAFQVNVFCHAPAVADPAQNAAWIAKLTPEFARFGAPPPTALREIYTSFLVDDSMLAMLLEERPPVVSFHFGLPSAERIAALKGAGIVLLASATNLAEAQAAAAAGVEAIVAQGYEAGGHRGAFDPAAPDERLPTAELVRRLAGAGLGLPIVAAGGIMDGRDVAAMLSLGAAAAQLGTAFIACPESSADAGFRTLLASPAAAQTAMTAALSGRTARSLPGFWTELGAQADPSQIPSYPLAYDVAKSLAAAARTAGASGYAAYLAGQGAPRSRPLPAAELVAELRKELEAASGDVS